MNATVERTFRFLQHVFIEPSRSKQQPQSSLHRRRLLAADRPNHDRVAFFAKRVIDLGS